MKKFLFSIICLMSANSWASLHYDVTINSNGYILNMDMTFQKGVELSRVRGALKNGELLSRMSPNVVSVTNTDIPDGKYKSLMVVRSFGIYSRLLSQCLDRNEEKTWSRSCSLQTRELDGGKYMIWKGDEVTCLEKDQVVSCHFVIKGQARPVRILGVQIVSAELFSLKAKVQALANFFKLYTFIEEQSLSVKSTLAHFNNSVLKTELEQMEKDGTKAVKSSGQFTRTFSLQETK